MNDLEIRSAIARSIYWGYMKDTTGTPGRWSTLGHEERKIWNNAAKRALAKLAEVAADKAEANQDNSSANQETAER